MIASLPTPDFVAIRASFRLSPLFMTRDDFQIEGGLDLMRLLLYSLNTQATDPRDKVIALLGLASQQCRNALVPDYSKSTTQIYTETARHIIQSTGDLNILAINTASPRAGADPPLPSWVPNWALPTTSRPPTLLQPSLYRASGPYAAYVGPPPPSDPTILEAGGIPLDRIAHVLSDDTTTIAPAQDGSSTTTTALRRTVRALHDALLSVISARERAASATTTGAHDAHADALARLHRAATLRLDPDPRVSDQFWRTLVADAMVIRDDDYEDVHGGGSGDSLASPAPDGFAELFELFLPAIVVAAVTIHCHTAHN
ncbi:putative heterokaryon incompatibility protein [Diplodia seriata]|uniref:Putative heterokaryon incompatibility protein n=1 Tax=Diplodia seriata TaxID=420778 RepID=A0A0G2GG54_9PEZI|nr:putative heterokaryon incompatibility protein [Diplodia seriata]